NAGGFDSWALEKLWIFSMAELSPHVLGGTSPSTGEARRGCG
ncbi:MAG: hypothetical protein JWQ22_1457, partial [Devosia sp.]|nr:hypothetical protein [Devosia sp.]